MTPSNTPNLAEPATVPPTTSSGSLESYLRARLANVKKILPAAALELKAAGVVFVHVHYDGCGDSGQIESIEYLDNQRVPVDPTHKITLRSDQLMDLFYDLLEVRHGGWENEEGAYGDFEWDLENDALRHVHNDRFIDYDTTEHEGL